MRITQKTLERMVEDLNKNAGLPSAWTKTEDGPKANPGSFVLDAACGGYRLAMISTFGGGENDVSGYCTARELYNFIIGMSTGADLQRRSRMAKEYAEGEEDRDARRRAAQADFIDKHRMTGRRPI